ncbi:unnamed protein product [Calypogeia fissa]
MRGLEASSQPWWWLAAVSPRPSVHPTNPSREVDGPIILPGVGSAQKPLDTQANISPPVLSPASLFPMPEKVAGVITRQKLTERLGDGSCSESWPLKMMLGTIVR